jgi:hypothetical protein
MTQHLIHIGWPKAGSSFLQEWFARHPELHYSPNGIAGFSDVLGLARVLEMPYRYHVTSAENLAVPSPNAGHAHPGGGRPGPPQRDAIQPRQAAVCTLLSALFPGSRVLIVTRGFRSLVRSGYSQGVRMGFPSRPASRSAPGGAPQTGAVRPHHYDYVIGLYRAAFGAENVIVLPYELLRDDQARFLATLEERLGLEHVEIPIGRVNESLTPEELYWYPVISRAVSAVTMTIGERAYRTIYPRYVWLTFHNRLRPLVRVLSRIRPGRRVTEAYFGPRYGLQFAGQAESLRGDPLYAPYADDYLWTEESLQRRRFTR